MNDVTPGSPAFAASPLLHGLSAHQVEALRTACEARAYAAGEVMLSAGTVSDGLHVIENGAAEVLALGKDESRPVVVATLGPGQAFGELSALTGSPAISTVRAAQAATRVRTLAARRLDAMPEIGNTVLRNIIRVNQERLSNVNASYAKQLEETVKLLALRTSSARLLILVVSLMCITMLTNYWLTLSPGVDIYSPEFAWAALITLVLPTLIIAWHEKLPLRTFGVTTRNLGPDLAWSSGIVVGVLAVGSLALWLIGYPLAERFHLEYVELYGPMYTLHSALQEFIGRGVLLGMMLRIFESRTWRQRQLSNIAVSMMFGLTHLQFGLAAVGLMMVFSLLLGSYYLVHRNLAGPILIHAVLGLSAFMFGVL